MVGFVLNGRDASTVESSDHRSSLRTVWCSGSDALPARVSGARFNVGEVPYRIKLLDEGHLAPSDVFLPLRMCDALTHSLAPGLLENP